MSSTDGRAVAPAAGTVVNAIPTGRGSAFAIDLSIEAVVTLTEDGHVEGTVGDDPEADPSLIERCASLALVEYAETAGIDPERVGARIRTDSEVPAASGLKSSSAAANATVLATLSALSVADEVDRLDACRLGVRAAREVGVTVTGAFDDASASMLGGVTVTDNERDDLLDRRRLERHALVCIPPERERSADAAVDRYAPISPMADLAVELALDGRYGTAMTVNGFAVCGALGRDTRPLLSALPAVDGVTLSGTGPSYVAIGERQVLEAVRSDWAKRQGTTRLVRIRNEGASPR